MSFEIFKTYFYYVPSHIFRTAGLIVTKSNVAGPCSSARRVFRYLGYHSTALKVNNHELKTYSYNTARANQPELLRYAKIA